MNDPISELLQERIEANDFPSAVYLAAEREEVVLRGALGLAVVEPKRIPTREDAIYDLASLTKPLVTGLLLAKLIEAREVDLDSPIGKYLGVFAASEKGSVTVRQLAAHTSGFAAWLPLYLLTKEPSGVMAAIVDHEPAAAAGDAVIYSDLNFITLACLIEHVSGLSLDAAAREEIFEPLGLKDTAFDPLPAFDRERIAASEKGNFHEMRTCIEMGFLPPGTEAHAAFRDYQIWGEVHDGNAWFLGGVSGHAGLFSTAGEVLRIALQFLPESAKILQPETTELFRTNFTPGKSEARSLGFQLSETPESTAGASMSPGSFGHLGFTGTSLWIDPATKRIFILLTNRTHAHALPFVNINSVRRRFHDLAIEALDKNSSN